MVDEIVNRNCKQKQAGINLGHCGLLLLILLTASGQPLAGDTMASREDAQAILPVDEAFKLGSYVEGNETRVFWHVMPGYFLYRDKFAFRSAEEAYQVVLDEGVLRQDEIFGEVQVLEGLIEVTVPSEGEFRVEYQGCAADGFCYPPQKKRINSAKKRLFP